MRIVALAGLPGTGKSALARELGRLLPAPVLDKDRVREALFAPDWVEHSREQDDLCVGFLHETVRDLARRARAEWAVLDGRTYTRAGSLRPLRALAAELDATLWLVECTCAPELALERLAADAGRHPAADRDAELYRRLAREARPLPEPKLVVDTSRRTPAELAAELVVELRP